MIKIILFVGLILRLINLNQSLWLDETVQAITSKGTFLGLFTELRGDFHPPLYHLLMWVWVHLFGNGEITMRLPSVFFGTATIFLVYKIAQKIFPKKLFIPRIAALFLATAPFHIYYSQEARTYAMTAFFATLSMYFFMRILTLFNCEKSKFNEVFLYIFSTVFLLYFDYYGLLVFLAQIIIGVVILRKKINKFLLYYASVFLLFLPCLPLLWIQLKTGSQATTLLPEWGRLVNLSFWKALPLTFVKFAIGRITVFNKNLYAFAMGILLLIYGMIFIRGFFKKRKFALNNSFLVILLWFLIPIFLAWSISFFIPNYQPFRLLLVLPAFYLLLAYGISRISNSMIQLIAVGFILLVNLISLSVYFFNPYFHREDWRGAIRYIEQQKGEIIALLPSETSHWPYSYYSKGKVRLISVGQRVQPISEDDLLRLSKDQSFSIFNSQFSIYYIYYLADIFDPQNLIPNWLESQKFVKIGEVSFNQIRIQEWKKTE